MRNFFANGAMTNYTGPGAGDRVQVETLGTVVRTEVRDGVNGALVDLDENGVEVWIPLRSLLPAGR